MSDGKYSGHTAEEVIELMGMLAAQYDVHSVDETLAIVRRGYALIKEQQSRLDSCQAELERSGRDWQAARDAHDTAVTDFTDACHEIKTLRGRLGALSAAVREAWDAKSEGVMWKALGNAIDIVDPARNPLANSAPPTNPGDASRKLVASLIAEQAEDEGLWFVAATAPEAYLQAALRKLHAAIEGVSPEECAPSVRCGNANCDVLLSSGEPHVEGCLGGAVERHAPTCPASGPDRL